MTELLQAVEAMTKAAVALRPFIQHTCDYSTSIGASSPDSDFCTCGLRVAVDAANEALLKLRVMARMSELPQRILPCPVGECDIKGVHHHNHGMPVNSGENAR